jgi:dTDP-4-dehydrorhamnose 3,5-epimerase
VSRQHVLRGLHGDGETWKLVSCLSGAFYLVVLNYDRDSDHFGKWISVTLSDKNRKQVLIPPKHANGHLVLSEKAIFHYKQNTYYNPKGQFTILWNDPKFNIWWPIKRPIISQRDEFGHFID